ncbi:MAG: class I SAM-dependent methyltransferase [Ruminococcaceae bacterium]|nr:class I SAM-dependent methyltransferase [Oscillospiraceae bacterium]
MADQNYTEINSKVFDRWNEEGWEWGIPISPQAAELVRKGEWSVLLTPTKPVPKDWFCPLSGAKILGLASGGGQQMPVFSILGGKCTVLDYSESQLKREEEIAGREGYSIELVRADMTKPLPFADAAFDLIFHPVSNCYIKDVLSVWKECFRVLRHGGILLSGLDNGFNYLFDDDELTVVNRLPFDPLSDEELFRKSVEHDWGIQFSHTVEEQIGGQLKAGFRLTDIYEDTNGTGRLHEMGAPTFWATRAVKPE